MSASNVLVFFVNGKKILEFNVNPEWTLLYYLRSKLNLCGTKLGCGEGGCGACTVMVSKYDRKQDKIKHYPMNACLAPLCSLHGLAITTVEGIGSTKTKLHPVQERIAKSHGAQCGFCTPGIVMSMYTLLRTMPKPKMEDLDIAFQGNLCRCTGYRPIIDGYRTFTEDWEVAQLANSISNGLTNGTCGLGDKCCKLQNGGCPKDNSNENAHLFDKSGRLFNRNGFLPYDQSQEPIFPPELKLNDCYDKEALVFKGKDVTWFRPKDIDELLQLKLKYPHAKIVVGNTEVGVEVKFKGQNYPVIIQPKLINELNDIVVLDNSVKIGAAVTWDEIEQTFKTLIQGTPNTETKIFQAVLKMLHWFAGKQIRNVASIGGNIMTGSPISDMNPIWMAAKAQLKIRSLTGHRIVTMDDTFYTGYRKTLLAPNEILESIEIPFTKPNQFFLAYRQARRREDDIAIVNSAISLSLTQDLVIEDIELAFGGLGPTTILCKNIKMLKGLPFGEPMLEQAYNILLDDIKLDADAPGGMIAYRRSLAVSFFFKSFLAIKKQLNQEIDSRDLSAIDGFSFKEPKYSQYFQVVDNECVTDTIGRPIVHNNAFHHASGEAIYTDDIPTYSNELYLAFIFSKKSHAKLLNVDLSDALSMPEVVDTILSSDIRPDLNITGTLQDEEYIITNTVTSQYQVLGGILAKDLLSAQKAVRKVKVTYEELQPIITIEQAIEKQAFHDFIAKIERGNVPQAFKNAKYTISGESRTGYQEHFYMEPHAILVVPREGKEFEIYSATQFASKLQETVSKFLEIDQNKIYSKVKRIGGGFGGKEVPATRYAPLVALASRKVNRPVRLVLERDEDMGCTGGRNAILVKYKLGFDENGKVDCAEFELFVNGGYSNDMSIFVCLHAVGHVTNSIHIPNVKITGRTCKTNLPTNTAFRGFGIPQAAYAAECMMRDVAEYLKKDLVDVLRINLLKEGDIMPYNQPMIGCNARRCFEEVLQNADFERRKVAIEKFNKENRWKKRGIDVTTITYGIGYGCNPFQQATALVLIYRDGSVLLYHGGAELGQGLHTKMIQVASRELGIPIDKIHTNETGTDKIPNAIGTTASMSSDLNGRAVQNACEIINKRLEPVKAKNPKGNWHDWIQTAIDERISLTATGYYREPEVNWDWDTSTGDKLFNYYSFGAACTEVEIDCLTGDHQVLRTDIVMDLGNSLNPAIDIGQVEGGFVQGYGLYVMEEMVVSPDGTFMSKGPGAYKVPGFGDIPIEFNVALLKDSSNPNAIYSSKAIGEPPLILATSAAFAIREAIKAARREAKISENVSLNAPITAEKIRMACQDDITAKIPVIKSTWRVDQL